MTMFSYMSGQFSLMQTLDFFVRILVSAICGSVIGVERSRRFKEAGIRTHLIVCCAASMIMIVSKYGFVDLTSVAGIDYNGTRGADPARIAAQVISGVSFLGAGVIFRNGSTVKGLTTAAGLWATAGIGIACGAGMYSIAIFVTFIIAFSQVLMHKFTIGADSYETYNMKFIVKGETDGKFLLDQISEWNGQITTNRVCRLENNRTEYEFTVKLAKKLDADEFYTFLNGHEEIFAGSNTPIR